MIAMHTAHEFPIGEISSALSSFGGWLGWMDSPDPDDNTILALRWMAIEGYDLPAELVPLLALLSMFGRAPIEEAEARVRGLEDAFRKLEGHIGKPRDRARPSDRQTEEARRIIATVLKYAEEPAP